MSGCPFGVAVIVAVVLAGFFGVMDSMDGVTMRDVGVMTSSVMVAVFVVLGGGAVVLSGFVVVFRGFVVMFCGCLRHGSDLTASIRAKCYAAITGR